MRRGAGRSSREARRTRAHDRRSKRFSRLVDAQPALLYHGDRPVQAALHRHRLTESDLHSAARENGMGSLDDVEAVILQADGTLAVIASEAMGDGSSVRPFVHAPA